MAEQSLKEKTAKGLLWGGLSNGVQQLLNLAFGIFLGRLLTAEDYGMVGMLTIFSLIAGSIQESGFTAALANKKEVGTRDYNAVFWGTVLISLTLYALLFFSAPLIADFFKEPELIPLGRFIFLGFVLSAFGTAHNAYMYRNLLVKQKALANIIALCFSGVVAVTLAYNGFAYWGIATQTLVYVGTNTTCYWIFTKWRPNFHIDLSPLKELFGFSSKLLITNVFNHINNNIFSVILGRYYSEREVGFYNQASKWSYMAHVLVSGMVSSVAQPVLARAADERERQCRVFRKMLRFTAFVSFPTLLGLSLIAPEFITITITAKWLPSAEILRVLCIGGAFIPIASIYTNLLISKGKSDIFMWNTIALGILQLFMMLRLYPYGLEVMINVYVGINILWLFVWHYFVWREIRLGLFSVLKDIAPYFCVALLAMFAAHFPAQYVDSDYLSLLIKVGTAAGVYFLVMWWSGSVIFRECLHFFAGKLGISRSE